ncbi:hypothetical protein AAF712_010301 [Marasmius tenuissimus]|uniref:Xylanolytic transcriptional activator regulatory domain-containing protein n=1 Tax=Marasmius tenuissimus TaxID=585030 RepID=A0ABR2ZNF2_9AGAR
MAETLDDVVNRLGVVEKVVSRLSKFLPQDLFLSIAAGRADILSGHDYSAGFVTPNGYAQPSPAGPGHTVWHEHQIISEAPRSPEVAASSDEEIAMVLEDFAMGNRINRHRAASELLADHNSSGYPWSTLSHTVEPGAHSLPTPPTPNDAILPFCLSEFHPLSLFVDPSTNIIPKLASLLPHESQTKELIEFYGLHSTDDNFPGISKFARIEWYTKIFHYPSFVIEANEHLREISRFGSSSAGGDVPAGSGFGQISLPFLSTMFMVLCLGLHLIEPEICQRLNIGSQEAATLSKRLYSAAQACLWIDNYESNHTLESVQCLILMGVYQQNLDDADSQWALLGSAIKIAQNLGLSRLGSENENRTFADPWRSIIRRETARRVWWNLVFNDWSHAAAHNGAYSIHPSQNFTGLPANVNDTDLIDGREIPVDNNQYTQMTFSLTRFRFVEIYREIVDNSNLNAMLSMYPHSGYSNSRNYGFVIETDARLATMLNGIPSQFQHTESGMQHPPIKQETMGVQDMETLLALIMGETRRMRLHRPYLYKGYHDRKYAKSTEQCIDSARAILHYLKSTPEHSAIFLKWWLVMFYGFGAVSGSALGFICLTLKLVEPQAVVLFIDLCHLKTENPSAVESRKMELKEALNLFKLTRNVSTVSQNAIALLEGMLAVGDPRGSSRKRGAPGSIPMERIAKRIMVDAANTGVPAQAVNSNASDAPRQECRPPYHPASSNMAKIHPHGHQPHLRSHREYDQLHPHEAQWLNEQMTSPSTEWNTLGLEPGAQLFFGPEFDEATINELGQLLWTPESDSGVAVNAKATNSSVTTWASQNTGPY